MNKNLYRLVFSKKFGALIAVAETTVSQGKNAGETAGAGAHGFSESQAGYGLASSFDAAGVGGSSLASLSFAVALAFAGASTFTLKSFAQSVLPTGGVITKGSGTITTSGNTMTINQGTNVLGANWNSFSIGASNTVIFNQPSSSSVAINRVIGNSQSQIYGNLQSNGQVFLINPNGVMFGKGAQVQVGALVATTKNITDAQIDAGNYSFSGGSTAGIINQGMITAMGNGTAGYVVLHADKVTNDGTIVANGGMITLAAGQTLGLTLDNGQLLSVQVTGAVANALVQNQGLIVADGGQVFLTARGKDTLLDNVVNNEGVIRARSMTSKNGVIILDGGDEGAVVNSGTLDVSGKGNNKGGTAIMAGQYVALLNNSTVNASGDAGGGAVIIGGDNLNKVTSLLNFSMAAQTVVQAGANIDISSANGSGGFVETSGHLININGNINGAGKTGAGQWLIDPTDITIVSTASTNGSFNGTNVWSSGANATSNISNTSIVNALNSTDVLITTTSTNAGAQKGNITVSADIIKTNSTVALTNLTLLANGSITVSNNISATGGAQLGINLTADSANVGNGSVNITSAAALNTNGGNLNIRGNTTALATVAAVTIGGNLALAGNAVANIVGYAGSGVGVHFSNATAMKIALSGNSSLNITGTSATGWAGVYTNTTTSATLINSGNGTLLINGSVNGTAGRSGVEFGNSAVATWLPLVIVNNGTSGSINLLGYGLNTSTLTGPGKQAGFWASGGVNITTSSSGSVVVYGRSDANVSASIGLDMGDTAGFFARNTGNGSLDVTGVAKNANGFGGVYLNSGNFSLINSGNGSSNFSGTSLGTSDPGAVLTGIVTLVNNGSAGYLSFSALAPNSSTAGFTAASMTVNVTSNGNTDITTQSNSNVGMPAIVPIGSTVNAGNGTITYRGISNTGTGLNISAATTLNNTQRGGIVLSGSSTTGVGVNITGGTVISRGAGNVSILGTSNNTFGVLVGNSINLTNANITGFSNGAAGVQFAAGTNNISGNSSVTGSSAQGSGIVFAGGTITLNSTAGNTACITGITGNSTNSTVYGLNLSGTLPTVTGGAGTIIYSGTANAGAGIFIGNATNLNITLTLPNTTLTGSSFNGTGVLVCTSANITLAGMTILGASTNNAAINISAGGGTGTGGVILQANSTINTTGILRISGNKSLVASGDGVVFLGNVTASNTLNNITGYASRIASGTTAGAGVNFSAGNQTIGGFVYGNTSAPGSGANNFGSGGIVFRGGNQTIVGATSNVTGESNAYIGVSFSGGNQTFNGAVLGVHTNASSPSSVGGGGVGFEGGNQVFNGNVTGLVCSTVNTNSQGVFWSAGNATFNANIAGTAIASEGLYFAAGNVVIGGNVNVTGVSSGNGTGVRFGASTVTFNTASGQYVNIVGSSATNVGVAVDAGVSQAFTNSGSGNLTLVGR